MKKYDFDIKELYLNEYFRNKNSSIFSGFSDSSISTIQNSIELNNFIFLLKKMYLSENENKINIKIDLLDKMLIDIDNLLNKKIIIKRDKQSTPESFDFTVNNFSFSEKMFIEDSQGFISLSTYSYISDILGIEHVEEPFFNFESSSYFRVDDTYNIKNDSFERNSFNFVLKKISSFFKKEYDTIENSNFLNLLFHNLKSYSEPYRDIFKYTDINIIKIEKNKMSNIIDNIKFHSDLLELSQDYNLKPSISGIRQIQNILNNNNYNLVIK